MDLRHAAPALVLLAHPIGFVWLSATVAYVKLRRKLPGWWKSLPAAAAASGLLGVHWFMARHAAKYWSIGPWTFCLYNGADQLALYGSAYVYLAGTVFLFALFCVAADLRAGNDNGPRWGEIRTAVRIVRDGRFARQGCCLRICGQRPMGMDWAARSRLTTISAIFGLCVLGLLKPRKWHLGGFGVGAIVFLRSCTRTRMD